MVKIAEINHILYLEWIISPHKHVPRHFLFLSRSFLFRVMTAISQHEKETLDSQQSMFAGPKPLPGREYTFPDNRRQCCPC